jgi:hypothetical protein
MTRSQQIGVLIVAAALAALAVVRACRLDATL